MHRGNAWLLRAAIKLLRERYLPAMTRRFFSYYFVGRGVGAGSSEGVSQQGAFWTFPLALHL